MSLLAYPDAPGFAAGIDLQTTDGVATLWDATRILDMASLAPRALFCGHAGHRHEHVAANPLRFASGGFRYRPGLASLGIYLDAGGWVSVAPRLRVRVNGVVRIDAAIAAGIQAYTAGGMGGWGLADGQVAEVAMEIYDSAAPASLTGTGRRWGTIYLVDAHVGPASAILAEAWPGVPTFTTGPDEAGMLQLSRAADWLARRLNVVPQPLFRPIWAAGDGTPWWTPEPGEAPRHVWSGGLIRGPFDRLRGRVVWVPGSGTSQRVRLLLNGAEAATTPTWTGASGWGFHDYDVSLSAYGAASVIRAELEYVVAGPNAGGYPPRLSMLWMEAHRATPAFATLADRPVPFEQTTWAVRRARLNQIANALSAIKARVDADSDRWDRIRLYRGPYAYDAGQADYYRDRHPSVARFRAGTRVVVRGSNLSLGWGPASATLRNDEEPFGEYTRSWASTETLVGGDDVQTREVLLGALAGMEPGFAFAVYGGDVRYAAEELR